jgi:type II secretory pathway pseudopilin PulG
VLGGKQMIKRKNGITLIALVITIIVLILLAGVSIASLTDDDGIADKAVEARTKTKESSDKELESVRGMEELIADKLEAAENATNTTNEVDPENTTNEVDS